MTYTPLWDLNLKVFCLEVPGERCRGVPWGLNSVSDESNWLRLWGTLYQMVKNLPALWETQVQSLGREDPREKGMATHSSILAWRIPWTEEPGGLQSMELQSVGHDWASTTFTSTWGTSCPAERWIPNHTGSLNPSLNILGGCDMWGFLKSAVQARARYCWAGRVEASEENQELKSVRENPMKEFEVRWPEE